MTLPVKQKTWQIAANHTVTAQGTADATDKRLIRTLKNLFLASALSPWTVRYSCNSVAAGAAGDGVDRWAADADIVRDTAGSAHSWIVLRQTGIATNFEMCFDVEGNSGLPGYAAIYVSPSVGFSGGSVTARPTAADQVTVFASGQMFTGENANHRIHFWQSTDGQCTRVSIWRGTTNNCTFMLFDKPAHAVSGWTNPSASLVLGLNSGIVTLTTTLASLAAGNTKGRGSAAFGMAWTAQSCGGTLLHETTGIGTVANDLSGEWPFFPIGLACETAPHRGVVGSLADIYWRPAAVASADTFPNNAATRDWVAFGEIILPWTGGADVPALA